MKCGQSTYSLKQNSSPVPLILKPDLGASSSRRAGTIRKQMCHGQPRLCIGRNQFDQSCANQAGTSRSMVGTRHARRASRCLEINKDGSSTLRLCEPRHCAKPVTALARSARRFQESWASCMRRTSVSPWAAACHARSVNTFVRSSSACRRSLPGCRSKRTSPIRPADVTSQLPPWLPSVRAKTGVRAHFDACR